MSDEVSDQQHHRHLGSGRVKANSVLLSPLSYMSYHKMPDTESTQKSRGGMAGILPSKKAVTPMLIASYALDWICLVIAGVIGVILGNVTPNRRPFQLEDPNISFPFTEHETVTSLTLVCCNAIIPIGVILIVALVFVPGPTVPKGTPRALVWRRKLWELHAGWLGLATSLMAAWFITQGMKNMFGKPRPDLLSRCQPDLANTQDYVLGGMTNSGQLVSADICKNPDKALLEDGFRSYPSGHSSSAAAGLIYLSFFLASKFSVTIPFPASGSYYSNHDGRHATSFPSRFAGSQTSRSQATKHAPSGPSSYEAVSRDDDISGAGPGQHDDSTAQQLASHSVEVLAIRRQAAAPPIYLLLATVLPFFLAIFIASSRWFDFRHHGFDILFGFIIGTICAWFAFRFYHLPISQGAGWAWAPRSVDKAFWAGVGSYSYATDNRQQWMQTHNMGRVGDVESGLATGQSIEMTSR